MLVEECESVHRVSGFVGEWVPAGLVGFDAFVASLVARKVLLSRIVHDVAVVEEKIELKVKVE